MKRIQTKWVMLLIVLITSMSLSTFAQEQGKGKGKVRERLQQKQAEIEAERVVFYNNYLKLSTVEADKFWPLYKEYIQKQRDLKKNTNKKIKSLRGKTSEELTKEESGELIKANFELKQALLDLEKEYVTKFQTAISIQKVAKLKEAESEFKKDLVKKAREKKKERMNKKQAPQ